MTTRAAATTIFVTSALVLVLEIVAGRLMAPFIGVSLEAFTGIIGTVLAGIAAGSAVGGRLADRRDPRKLIGLALLAGGALTLLSVPIVVSVGGGMSATPVNIVILTACGFLLPAALLSAIGPMVTKLTLSSLDETGEIVGMLSAAGTAGALVGTFGTGFLLLGLFPVRSIILTVGALLVVAGVIALWKLAGTRPDGFQSSLVAIAAFLSIGIGTSCDLETDYACARIVPDADRPGGRSLILDRVRHAHVDVDDPAHLEIRYARLLGDVIDTLPDGPVDALHVGGGGFSIPRWLTATRPGSTNTVLEIDAGLVDLARDRLDLAAAENLDVHIGDARILLHELPAASFDVIVGDAFGGDVVPWHLTTVEAVGEYARLLRPGGVYVMNLIDGGESRFARAQMRTLREHFDNVDVILPIAPPSTAHNQVIFAWDGPPIAPVIDRGDGFQVSGDEALAYVRDAQLLTDDFAPAEQLKS